jgi:phosphoribosylformylglycinamidine cyclo-ligase
LIRKVIPDLREDFGGMPIGMALLEPTRLYVKPVLSLMEKISIHGMAHITGGGFYENIPRMFHASKTPYDAVIRQGSWPISPIFARIACGCLKSNAGVAANGKSAEALGAGLLETDQALKRQMFNTFNMGIGFVLALAPEDAPQAIEHLDGAGFPAWEIGEVVEAAESAGGALRFAGD